MDKNELISTAALMVVGIGVEKVVSNTVKEIMPEESNGLGKVLTWIGVSVISIMIADKVYDYMEPKVKGAIDYINKVVVTVKEELK